MALSKGEQRRAALVRAASEVLLEEGFDAVTHRAVAARAELPLGATTYYFTSREDLLAAAVGLAAQDWLDGGRERLAALTGADPARRVLGVVTAGRAAGALVPLYSRYLEAARRPGLRAVVADLDAQACALVAQVLEDASLPADAETARLVLATADGLLVGALAAGADDPAEQARPGLARLLALLATAQASATQAVIAL